MENNTFLEHVNTMELKEAAVEYVKAGFKIVPRCPGSTAFVFKNDSDKPGSKPNPFTTVEEVETHWTERPDDNISIIEPKLLVVDIDQKNGKSGIEAIDRENLPETAIQFTPNNGAHLFYWCEEGPVQKQLGDGIDIFSGDAALMVAPSRAKGGEYYWAVQKDIAPANDYIKSFLSENGNGEKKEQKEAIPDVIEEGERNNTLTRIAGYYAGQGFERDTVFKLVLAENQMKCKTPLPQEEVWAIVLSIFAKEENEGESLRTRIINYIKEGPGVFATWTLDQELALTQEEKNNRATILSRLAKEGWLERGNQRGLWRIKDKSVNQMRFTNVRKHEVSLPLPLGLPEYTKVKPRNVIVVAGATNGGKTTFVMNLAYNILNLKATKMANLEENLPAGRGSRLSSNYVSYNPFYQELDPENGIQLSRLLNQQLTGKDEPINVRYFTSEMGEEEFIGLAEDFPGGEDSFLGYKNFIPIERNRDFQDVVEPDGINIIDFMKIHDKFYKIGETIDRIHEQLNKGIVVICLQKKEDKNFGRGGEFAAELSRLSLALDKNPPHGHICTITKNKIPLDPKKKKLEGESIDFKIGGGARIKPISEWRIVKDQKQRKAINQAYEAGELEDADPQFDTSELEGKI